MLSLTLTWLWCSGHFLSNISNVTGLHEWTQYQLALHYCLQMLCQLHGQWNTVFFPTPSLSYKSTIVNFGCSTVSLSQSTVGEWVTIILIVWSYFMFYFHTCNIFCRRNACSLQIDDASSIVIMKVDMEMMFYIRVVFCNWAFFCVCVYCFMNLFIWIKIGFLLCQLCICSTILNCLLTV